MSTSAQRTAEQRSVPRIGRGRHSLRSMGLRDFSRAAWAKLIFEQVFPRAERLGVHVLPVHFYSPVPDTRSLRRNLERWHRDRELVGVDLDLDRQRQVVEQLHTYRSELEALPSEAEVASRGFGEGFGEVESLVLHAMLRTIRPRTLIEVGSGVSTFFSANAMSLNKRQDGVDGRIVCVEPYPRRILRDFADASDIPLEIIPKPVQDVEVELFEELGKDDVLFVDSSHVWKLDSDVDRLYLEVFPRLRPGVFIHIHDIPFPYFTHDPQHWVFKKHRFWNEAALLYAFMAFNASFRVTLSLSYLHQRHPETLGVLSTYRPGSRRPSSIWIERVS